MIFCRAINRHTGNSTPLKRPFCAILSDSLTAADEQRVTLLGLLDLTAAFDCVDHSLLLQRLQCNVDRPHRDGIMLDVVVTHG